MLSDEQWTVSRKRFVKTMVLGGAALQLPWLSSCRDRRIFPGDTNPLSEHQFKVIQAVQEVLFPSDGNGPGAYEVNADTYLIWVLNDENLDPDENRYIIDTLNQFEAFSKEHLGYSFIDLNPREQLALITETAQLNWGKRWLSRLLTLIFEALLLDPMYGGNTDSSGWTWLEHNPGLPRPQQTHRYPEILNLSHEV
jgi:gluconate 2-dehydrogenase gamma chain